MYEPMSAEEIRDLVKSLKEKSEFVFSPINVSLFSATQNARDDLNIKLSNIAYGVEKLQRQIYYAGKER